MAINDKEVWYELQFNRNGTWVTLEGQIDFSYSRIQKEFLWHRNNGRQVRIIVVWAQVLSEHIALTSEDEIN